MTARIIALCSVLALAACAASPSKPGEELFDEQTGNTVTVVSEPIVFARERNDVAAYARDYVTLVAVEVDHSGQFKDYLLLYRWSTVDKRMLPPPDPSAGKVRLVSEGRELDLDPLESMPVGLGSGRDLHLPPHGEAIVHGYAVDLNVLRFIAASRTLILQMPQETLDTPFTLWQDGRRALGRFVHQTSSP